MPPVYVTAGIHGHSDRYPALLERIQPGPGDTLYVLADSIGRGPDGIAGTRGRCFYQEVTFMGRALAADQ